MTATPTSSAAQARAIAEQLVRARRSATPLAEFPGPVPTDLETAYAIQSTGIALWPDAIAGWKVGRLAPHWQARFHEERLVGPIFGASIRASHAPRVVEFPMYEGGFAAVEAELIFRLNVDAPAAKKAWTSDEASALDVDVLVGIETAGSPFSDINEVGPGAIVSDFGNNAGLILGPGIADWRRRDIDSIPCEVSIESRSVGQALAGSLPGGPLAGLAFALARCAQLGRPLKAGDLVSSGAITGIHDIRVGQSAHVSFGVHGDIHCRAVRAGTVTGARPKQATASW